MKIFKYIKQNNKIFTTGFTLVETLVAISIFTMSIVVLMSVLGSGISNVEYAKSKMIAGYLAQEGIEYARNVRDTNVLYDLTPQDGWNAFKALNNTQITPPSFSGFNRTVTKTNINPDEVEITSIVSWTQKSGNFNITLKENLFNWVE